MTERAIAIDSETTGLYLRNGCRGFLFTACDIEGKLFKWHFRVNPLTRNPIINIRVVQEIYDTLNSYDTWVFHNSTFDLTVLSLLSRKFNLDLYESKTIHDTMIQAHCHNSGGKLGLKPLAFLHLGYPEDDEKELHDDINKARRIAKKLGWAIAEPTHPHLKPLKGNKKFCDYWLPYELAMRRPDLLSPGEVERFLNSCTKYAMGDVERTMGLHLFFQEALEQRDDWFHYLKHARVILPTWEIQNQGFTVKSKVLPKTIAALQAEKKRLEKAMADIVGDPTYNPKSGPQTAKYLFEDKGLDVPKFTASGNPSTDKESLEEIAEYPSLPEDVARFISLKLTYAKFNTSEGYQSSYQRFLVGDKLYASLKIPGTKTLRYSCQDPNANNISKQKDDQLVSNEFEGSLTVNLRNIFGPPPGYIWVLIDYTQLQLRIFAKCCNDPFLLQAFKDGADIHDTVAREVFATKTPTDLERRAAKAINFGIIFGAGQRKIESMSGIPGSYHNFKERFPLVDAYITEQAARARKDGFIRTLGGYPLRVEKRRAYKACNIIVQGTEGEMVKSAICGCHRVSRDLPFVPIMVVHDEIIFQSKYPMTIKEYKDSKYAVNLYSDIMNQAAKGLGIDTTTDMKYTNTTWAQCR